MRCERPLCSANYLLFIWKRLHKKKKNVVFAGIVYVFSQKDAEVVAADLQKRDILAQPYHANMEPSDKSLVHQRWSSKKIQVAPTELLLLSPVFIVMFPHVILCLCLCRWSLPLWLLEWALTRLMCDLLSITPSANLLKIIIRRVDVQVGIILILLCWRFLSHKMNFTT